MQEQLTKEITELKTEIKYIGKTLTKLEKVLENQAVLLEKQSVANNRIQDLEDYNKSSEVRIRKLEDWQIRIITIATFVSTIGSTIIGIFINK